MKLRIYLAMGLLVLMGGGFSFAGELLANLGNVAMVQGYLHPAELARGCCLPAARKFFQQAQNLGTRNVRIAAYLDRVAWLRDQYSTASPPDPARHVPALYHLWETAQQQGQYQTAEAVRAKLLDLRPEYAIGQAIGSHWMLLGYDLNERELEFGLPTQMTIYWQATTRELVANEVRISQAGGWEWYGSQDRVYQVGRVQNLVGNAGFELTPMIGPGVMLPEYWAPFFQPGAESLEWLAVLVEERDQVASTVVAMSNHQANSLKALYSPYLSINPDSVYLVSVALNSHESVGRLGIGWVGSTYRQELVFEEKTSGWRTYSRVLHSSPDVTAAHMILVNPSPGTVLWDNLVLVEMTLPPQTW